MIDMDKKIDKKALKVFPATIVGMLLLCVLVFYFITIYMTRQNTSTLNQVADTYMQGMSVQIQNHFDTLLNMRLIQVRNVLLDFPPEEVEVMDDNVRESLASIAQSRRFTHTYLLDVDGNMENILGNPIEIEDADNFLTAMNNGETMVSLGMEDDGTSVLLYGVSVGYPVNMGYPLSNGNHCTALLVGVPIQNLTDALSLGADDSLIFTNIVRPDGTYVVNNSDFKNPEGNCYDWILNNGREADVENAEEIAADLREAITERKTYSSAVPIHGETRHFRCTPLANTEWMMLSVMPHGVLDEALATLGQQRVVSSLVSCGIIMGIMLVVYFIYWSYSTRQMKALAEAKEEALAADSLNEIGVHAEWALDGPTAIDMTEKRHMQHRDYYVVLLDCKMPGMDGITTAREMRRRIGDNLPILLMSAYDWDDVEEDARDAGITGFISKPLFKSTLYHSLKPFAEPETEKTDLPAEPQMDFSGKRLLVAEDNELNWEIANELLSSVGFVLDWAENGKLCVEKFTEVQPGYYDAILMDLRMPEMNGFEATQAIRAMEREDAKEIPIIAMTADAFSDDVKTCLDCGMNGHVAKPLNIPELLRLLEKYC